MSEHTPSPEDYSLSGNTSRPSYHAPELPYKPRDPGTYRPKIGMIACGGITESHLTAYSRAGYDVVALCDLIEERARKRQSQFYPNAMVTTDYRELLSRDDIEVVDIATHPRERAPIIEDALIAGKHVLSQKPFVLDLGIGERLVALASQQGLHLAVNQNGRWAPHFSYIREAVKQGLIGELMSVHMAVHWDHSWTVGTPFENIEDLIFYDFAIHWFDMVSHLWGDRKIERVHASKGRAIGQVGRPPMLAEAIIEVEGGQSSLIFDAHVKYGHRDSTYVAGTHGTLRSVGPHLGSQTVTLFTEHGHARPSLEGEWFHDGFHGTMGELLCSIEEGREPINSARENLGSLALCFAAIASATEGISKRPGEVRRLPKGSAPGAD